MPNCDVMLDRKTAFDYFRLGLVTGLIDRQALVQWADREIMRDPTPEPEIIELSLAGDRPYSEIIWLLSSFTSQWQSKLNDGLPAKLLLARAGGLLEQDPGRVVDIMMGLRLLVEEDFLPKELKSRLGSLKQSLDLYRQAAISLEDLVQTLSNFLQEYSGYHEDSLNIVAWEKHM